MRGIEIKQTNWEELSISNDFLFGKVMQNPELCKGLLQRILPDLEIDRIEYPELQKTIREDVDARSVRLDVYVKDGIGTVYNIEMQAVNTRELPKRSRYYQSMIDLQLMDKNQSYKELNKSYIIFICLKDIFGCGRHMYTFENFCKEEGGLALNDGATKIFLNASSNKEDVSPSLKAFLDYVVGRSSEDDFVRELEEAVNEAKKNREWRHEYMTLLMRDQENREIGREEGKEIGREIGREEGKEIGREEGKVYGAVVVYRDLNFTEETIVKKLQEKFNLTEEKAKKYLL